jgi:hypothetical protein
MPLSSFTKRIKFNVSTAKSIADVTGEWFLPTTLLPAGFWADVAADGGDVRFVQIPKTVHNTPSEFYLYYGNGSISMPSVTDPEGRNACFPDVVRNDFLQDPTGSSPQLTDLSGNGLHGAAVNSPTGSADGWTFNGTNQWVDHGNVANMGTDSFVATVWFNPAADLTTATAGGRPMQKRGTGAVGSFAGWALIVYRSGTTLIIGNAVVDGGSGGGGLASGIINLGAGTIGVDGIIHMHVNRNGNLIVYYNGVQVYANSLAAVTGSLNNTRKLTHGASDVALSQFYKGLIKHSYISTNLKSAGGYQVEANNKLDPATFWEIDTVETGTYDLTSETLLPFYVAEDFDTGAEEGTIWFRAQLDVVFPTAGFEGFTFAYENRQYIEPAIQGFKGFTVSTPYEGEIEIVKRRYRG